MKNRKERLPIIVDLLTHKMIGTQEELLSELAKLGYPVTQATLSRDLKQLKTSKVSNGMGGYRYVLTSAINSFNESHSMPQLPYNAAISSIERSANIVVIKAPAYHAKLLSSAFERVDDSRLLASFSVTDSVLLVLAPNAESHKVYEMLSKVIDTSILNQYEIS